MTADLRVLLIAVGLANSACTGAAPAAVEPSILIENVTLISPERDAPLVGADVAIQEGRIAAIGRDLRPGGLTKRIDGSGRFLIPGLIDSHVHVGHLMALDEGAIERRPELVKAYRDQLPRAFLAFGFTTLVDVDLRPRNRHRFEATPLHPRLYHCGRGLRIAGGYGALRIPPDAAEEDFPHLIHEPAQAAKWPKMLDPARHTPAGVVERVAESQGICVKVFFEPGFNVFDWPVPRFETLDALRAETGARDLPLLIHATSVGAWRAALDARADVIAHGLWHWPGDPMDSRPPGDVQAAIDAAARSGIRVQPTLQALQHERAIFDWSVLDDPRIAWSLPDSVLAYLRTDEAQAARRAVATEYEEAARSKRVEAGAAALIDVASSRVVATLRLMAAANVALIFGSDTPSGEGIGNPPGLNGRLELQQWAEAGVAPGRILRAATLDNAETFGLSRELGSIEVGKRADLVLLGANPLESVFAYDSIETVILNGEAIAREALRPAD